MPTRGLPAQTLPTLWFCRVTEFLPANAGFVHQATFGYGENDDAGVVVGISRCAQCYRYRRDLRAHFEIAPLKIVQSGLVFEKYILGVDLTA